MKNIPINEQIVASYVFEGVKCYTVTQNALKGKFTLYKIVNKDYQKIITADSPLKFGEIVAKDREE
jgi:hypothetical protein